MEARLRGWKSIAQYLGVTQSTAIRWSKRDGFPIARTADGGTVYASVSDLDRWLCSDRTAALAEKADAAPILSGNPVADGQVEPQVQSSPLPPRPRRRLNRHLVAAVFIAVAAIAGATVWHDRTSASRPTLPPALADRYLDARANWAERTPASLRRAIAEFRAIVAEQPDFQPGFTGLADAYILSCEFNNADRVSAFRAANAAASTGLALAPDDSDANRITGFLTYWTSRDMTRARPYFQKALAVDTTSAPLLHLWYGNALVDAGDVRDGLAELRVATQAAPDSAAVLTDLAMAEWQAGYAAASMRHFEMVERRFPQHAAAFGARALFSLATGDAVTYLDQSTRWAALLGDRQQMARVEGEQAAYAVGGRPAMLKAIADAAPLPSPFWHGGNLPAAIAASLLGDRPRMLAIMARRGVLHENWRRLRFPVEPMRRWRPDPIIGPALDTAFAATDYSRYPGT